VRVTVPVALIIAFTAEMIAGGGAPADRRVNRDGEKLLVLKAPFGPAAPWLQDRHSTHAPRSSASFVGQRTLNFAVVVQEFAAQVPSDKSETVRVQ
jgi:hypothetical protein